MNNEQKFVHDTGIRLAEIESVESFSVTFKTITFDGEDRLVPELEVKKKGAKDGREGNS